MSNTLALENDVRLQSVLRILTAEGPVSQRMRHSVQSALSVIPTSEEVIAAYRGSVLSGTSGSDGVALLTAERLSVYERRGFRSPDQKLLLSMAKPFTIEPGPGATRLTLTAVGGRSTTLELFEAERADLLRDELLALRSAREDGWWSEASLAWPGWLGAVPTWGYLGGDPRFHHPALDLRLHVGPSGFTLGDLDGSTAHLAPWSAVDSLRVVSHEEGVELAAARTLLVSQGFAAAWRSAEWAAFLVLGYRSGEQVFLGTTGLTEADLRHRLYPVAAAMPSGDARPPAPVEPEAVEPEVEEPEAVEPEVLEVPAWVRPQESPVVAEAEPPVAAQAEAPVVEAPVVEAESAGAPAPAYSLVEQLERLGVLYREGVLDGDEFVRAKALLLHG
jgi:hypothetical protein